MLVATTTELAARRQAIARSPVLLALSARLRGLLQPVLDRPLYIPERKAMLSQDGGACPDDGSRLEFDPLSPEEHRCPRCGRVVTGERHHLAWLMRYHLWLSERAIHLALLGALDNDPRLTTRANEIVKGYAERYRGYPNRDNVLGPTRLFFSTYLESIWLIQVSVAASISGIDVYDMIAESAGIVRSYDEGWSNRQVWNNAAMIAAGRALGDVTLVSRGLEGPHGIRAQLATAVTPDGFWFEGQNYHFFALRGMQLATEFLRAAGMDLYGDAMSGARVAGMYTAPLMSLLPDLTIPARSDSPFGVSVRQPRFAELWEVARVRTGDDRLAALLAELYRTDVPEGADHGLAEVSEVEQNRPPSRLHRDRLGWKALLWMDPAVPAVPVDTRWEPGSALSREHGLAVLRSPKRYVSVECGGRPGGHGHPDLLHLTLFWNDAWFMDFGTGSYVSPSLFWYRSNLAHNAPGLAGVGQLSRDGWCEAFDTRDEWTWCRAVARDVFGNKSTAHRTIIVSPDYVLDVVDVKAAARIEVDLPVHLLGGLALPGGVEREPASLEAAAAGHETGYDRLISVARLVGDARQLESRRGSSRLFVTLAPRSGEALFLAAAPGPPDLNFAETGPLEFLVRRAAGSGRWVQVYSTSPDTVRSVELRGEDIRIARGEGDTDTVHLGVTDAKVWSGTRSFRLSGRQRTPVREPPHAVELPTASRGVVELGAAHYRRSEEPYDPARFRAAVEARATGERLEITVQVDKAELVFRRATDPDPRLDNESPDIHSDGVQCYVGLNGWQGYVLVPDPDSPAVRVRAVAGTAGDPSRVQATWERTPGGYAMRVQIALGRPAAKVERIPFNVLINEMTPLRQRRAGQLALSGGGGWVYLRGDRESPESAVVLEVE